jgi:hypothetical protein
MAQDLEDNEVNVATHDNPETDDKFEVSIEDDTSSDANVKTPAAPSDDELDGYGAKVQKRINQLTASATAERRAKEEASRERDEAVRVAQALLKEKNDIQARFAQGEEVFIGQAREKAGLSVENAKRAYKDAYEAGDGDLMAEAQEKLAKATWDKEQAARWQPTKIAPQEEISLQNNKQEVYNQPQQAAPDLEAVKWAKKNSWFGTDKVMTAMAYGVHDQLMEEGITPTESPEEYYSTIEKQIRSKFPEYEWPDATREPNSKPATVVAGVNRNPKSNRVTLTKSQVSIANRLGLTPELYARELAKLETR